MKKTGNVGTAPCCKQYIAPTVTFALTAATPIGTAVIPVHFVIAMTRAMGHFITQFCFPLLASICTASFWAAAIPILTRIISEIVISCTINKTRKKIENMPSSETKNNHIKQILGVYDDKPLTETIEQHKKTVSRLSKATNAASFGVLAGTLVATSLLMPSVLIAGIGVSVAAIATGGATLLVSAITVALIFVHHHKKIGLKKLKLYQDKHQNDGKQIDPEDQGSENNDGKGNPFI